MKIILVDDHTYVREGIKKIIVENFPLAEVTDISDGETLLKKLIKEDFDLILLDITMAGMSGLDALKRLKELKPAIPVLTLTMHPPEQYAIRAFQAGASGYLTKDSPPDELVKAINQLRSGYKYITPQVAELLAQNIGIDHQKAPHESLSNRELDILRLLSEGKSISEIGTQLNISINTVSTFKSRILEKMNMRNIAELIKYVIEHKIFG
ncbi:MAG: response regulator transcription factor [Hydrotalea sp.]|jgi:DNA-binding NarL/FixJ family response regulator|nr:response regulator transcription factor [Hydrotalea sp.]